MTFMRTATVLAPKRHVFQQYVLKATRFRPQNEFESILLRRFTQDPRPFSFCIVPLCCIMDLRQSQTVYLVFHSRPSFTLAARDSIPTHQPPATVTANKITVHGARTHVLALHLE